MRYRVGTVAGGSCTERTACNKGQLRWRDAATALLLLATSQALFACGGGGASDERRDGVAIAPADLRPGGATTSAGAPGTKPICPATGMWQVCSVVERLERAGLAPRRQPDAVTEPPLSAPGIALLVGRSELRIFLYADRRARERDQARLDASKYVTPSDALSMQGEPTLIGSENPLGILRSQSDHQRERVSDALTAGPPQRPEAKS